MHVTLIGCSAILLEISISKARTKKCVSVVTRPIFHMIVMGTRLGAEHQTWVIPSTKIILCIPGPQWPVLCLWEGPAEWAAEEPQSEHHEAAAGGQVLSHQTHKDPLFLGPEGDEGSTKVVSGDGGNNVYIKGHECGSFSFISGVRKVAIILTSQWRPSRDQCIKLHTSNHCVS